MDEQRFLAERFEAHREHLRGVAFRMLGSLSEADDAVQESWLHVTRAGANGVENLGGWLTTIVARVCLDMLRARKSRREEHVDVPETIASNDGGDPEQETILAHSVGLALLVVLEALGPAERIAFVLHDMFGVSFDEIASIVGRSPDATRQLASRARRRVQGGSAIPEADLSEQRRVVDAYIAAMRGGDLEALVAVLDPDVVVRIVEAPGTTREVRGARNWAKGAITFSRYARFVQPALVNGAVGAVLAPRGRLERALSFRFANGKIVAVEVLVDPSRLAQAEIAML